MKNLLGLLQSWVLLLVQHKVYNPSTRQRKDKNEPCHTNIYPELNCFWSTFDFNATWFRMRYRAYKRWSKKPNTVHITTLSVKAGLFM